MGPTALETVIRPAVGIIIGLVRMRSTAARASHRESAGVDGVIHSLACWAAKKGEQAGLCPVD